jgi:group II intron reverse transcriptase/maturase
MKPTMEILARIKENSTTNKEEVFTKLYRYLLRPDIYYEAYKHLYSNKGAATKGINNDTADGFSEIKVNSIIQSLKNGTFKPTPVRRTHIEKKDGSGRKRPLGIPTFTDKIVQEVLRMVLEAIYEPIFLDCSHGFRPKKSCHTALKSFRCEFRGIKWFVEGDIKGCFDNINHDRLASFIRQKVADARIIQLIYRFLKAGYVEKWQYYATYSGTPQGGIISPLLANIYLHELDKYVMKLKNEFDTPYVRTWTPEYQRARNRTRVLSARINKISEDDKTPLIAEYKQARAIQVKTPQKAQIEKKLKYVRYADDFLIGVNGNHKDCEMIKEKLSDFISKNLKMELSKEKTLITHSNKYARFLGYDVRVRRNSQIRGGNSMPCKRRTLNSQTELTIPLNDKILKFMFNKGVIEQKANGILSPVHRPELLGCSDLEIVSAYNAELRGICNYYNLACNFCHLNYFTYLMEYSCLKTLANKHKTRISKIKTMFKDGQGRWGIPYETKTEKKRCYFAKHSECRKSFYVTDMISNYTTLYRHSVNSFEKRLSAKVCELCGTTENENYEIHHVHKLKDLKGKEVWEKAMIAKRRKTIVLCSDCHIDIHRQ